MQVPVKLDIPEEYVADYLNGTLEIAKAVVRNTKDGRIKKHIDLFQDTDVAENAKDALQNKNVLIGLGVAATIVIGGVITIAVKKSRAKSKVQLPECVMRFQEKFREYLKEAKDGYLNIDTINDLLSVLEEVEETQGSEVTIDFSTDELRTLLQQIFEYTNQLAEATGTNAENLIMPTDDSKSNLLNLRDYLVLQKKIVESAA